MFFEETFLNSRVLVTGDTGFKGAWLCHWLLHMGAEVIGVGLESQTKPNLFTALKLQDRMRHYSIDVRDFQSLEQLVEKENPEYVFHLAAQALVRESYHSPKNTFDVNVGGVVNLLEVIRLTGKVRACVVVTSDKCYENHEWNRGYHENDSLGGRDPYSASKGAAEIVTSSYCRSFFQNPENTGVASARAGNVLGGGDWSEDRIMVDLVKCIQASKPIKLRNPKAIRPWQHVLDPLSGYLKLAQTLGQDGEEKISSAWNFGPDLTHNFSVGQLAEAVVADWGQGRIEFDTQRDQPHEATLLKLDCSKAALELDWLPVWDFSETIRSSVEWYQAYYSGTTDMIDLTDKQLKRYKTDAIQLADTQAKSVNKPSRMQMSTPAA